MKKVIKINKSEGSTVCVVTAYEGSILLKQHRCQEEELPEWVNKMFPYGSRKTAKLHPDWGIVIGLSIHPRIRAQLCRLLEDRGYYAEIPF